MEQIHLGAESAVLELGGTLAAAWGQDRAGGTQTTPAGCAYTALPGPAGTFCASCPKIMF